MIKCDDGLALHCSHDERERGSLTSPPRLRDLARRYTCTHAARRRRRRRQANGTHVPANPPSLIADGKNY